MKPNSLLSICIPTYNRVETLKESLPDLIKKVKKYNVQIFISDNASNDGTNQYVKELQNDYPFIVFHSNPENYGSDKNVEIALKLSSTKYRWLLGDHYILMDENTLSSILPELEKNYSAVIVNYKNRKSLQPDTCVYTDKNLFVEELGWYIGMMCTTIFHEHVIAETDFKKFYNSYFLQTYVILNYISKYPFEVKWLPEELTWAISIKGEQSWHSKCLEIFAKRWSQGISSLANFNEKSKNICIKCHDEQINFFSDKNIILFRYINAITLNKVIQFFPYLLKTTSKKKILKMFLISFIPTFLIPLIWETQKEYIKKVLGGVTCHQLKF